MSRSEIPTTEQMPRFPTTSAAAAFLASLESGRELPANVTFFEAQLIATQPPEGGMVIGCSATVLKATAACEAHMAAL